MGRLFAGSNVPDLENAMTVFELAELKGRGDVQAVVLMLVVFLATQRMYHGPRTRAKAIVIDEAWDLLSGEDSKAFLEGAARRARKYRGALVTGTQSVNDYYANPAARAAWENSDWVIFLAQKDESVELLKSEKRIHCDPGMERALKSLTTADGRYAELVLHGPDGWRVARLVLDAWSVALFSSRGPPSRRSRPSRPKGLSTVDRRGHRPAPAAGRIAGAAPEGGASAGHSERIRNGGNRMTARKGPRRRDTDRRSTGRTIPENVTAADIDFEALAHVLANTCRRGGCTRHYHSVAAHAVIVSEEIEALDGLGDEDRRTLALHALVANAPSAWLRGWLPDSQRAAERAGSSPPGSRPRCARPRASMPCWRRNRPNCSASSPGWRPRPSAGTSWKRCRRERRRRVPAAEAAHPLDLPDKAAEGWLARFRALAGPDEERQRRIAAVARADGRTPDAGEPVPASEPGGQVAGEG